MWDTGLRLRFLILFLLGSVTAVIWLPDSSASAQVTKYLSVRFLDVGQGDAIHIVTPDGYEMLIDGGATAAVLRELAAGRSFFDRSIDVVVATHPDTDHIGGLVDVLERYDVDVLLQTAVKSDSAAATMYAKLSKQEEAQIILAQAGQRLQLGASTTVHVLSPGSDTSKWRSNAASIIVKVVYGETAFILTGDAPSSIEDYLAGKYGAELQADVLKLGHHGSKTSTSELFLNTVQPEFAVVSAGANNRYGHPAAVVTDRVEDKGIEIISTAESGTIVFQSDGKRVWVK